MRRGTAFTLVELLVVISIIALLMAMMLPVLGQARAAARAAACLSNLRQIWLGFANYAAQNSDALPPQGSQTPGVNGNSSDPRKGSGKLWYQYLADANPGLDGTNPAVTGYVDYSVGVWRCPSVAPNEMPPLSTVAAWGGGYGVSNGLIAYPQGSSSPWSNGPTMAQILRPSQLFLVGDVGRPGVDSTTGDGTFHYHTWGKFYPQPPFSLGSSKEQPACRHLNGVANVTFVDGHGAAVPYDDLNNDLNDMFAVNSNPKYRNF